MPDSTLICGEASATRETVGPVRFGQIFESAWDDDGRNFSAFCRSIGLSEETGRNYRDRGVSPAVDRLAEIIAAGRMPANLHLRLLVWLANGQFLVGPVPPPEEGAAGAGDQAASLRALMLEGQRADLAVVEQVHQALTDGRVDESEARSIELAVMRCREVKGRLVAGAIGMWQRWRRARS